MWKRNLTVFTGGEPEWMVGQYVPDKRTGYIGIRWFRVVLRDGPKPACWSAPDWSNTARYRRGGFYRSTAGSTG